FEAAVRCFFDQPDILVFGDESANAAYRRFSSAVYSTLIGLNGNLSVIVSHGTVISLFASRLTEEPGETIWNKLGLPGFVVLDMKSNTLVAIENIL
ncbi:MAG TPA: histidine phosphatase family protein, partial [Anaerolineales bacterium]|nr:histidine phosphatase family protein [Anaerolineales bacterium]